MTFKFNIGDIVYVIFFPSTHLKIAGRYVDGKGRNIYRFANKSIAAPEGARNEKNLRLVSRAEKEEKGVKHMDKLIIGLVIAAMGYYFLVK